MKITSDHLFQYFFLGSLAIIYYQTVYAAIADQLLLTQQQKLELAHKQLTPKRNIIFKQLDIITNYENFPQETPCFQIDNIEIIGKQIASFKWLVRKASTYNHRCIGVKGINRIVHDLTKELIARGYVTTRLGIPQQQLKTKTLKIVLIPGLIHQIKTSDQYHYGMIWNAFPTSSGQILNVRDLEQGLDQLQRNSSQTATMDITPAQQIGESDVFIERERTKPWHAVIALDNAGSVATGRIETSAMFSLDNLFALTDSLFISFNRDADSNSTRGINGNSIDYSIPFGYWTFGIAVDESKYQQRVDGTFQTFKTSGTSDTQSFRMQRLLHRNQISKTYTQLKILKRENKSYIDDEEIEVQHQNTTALELLLQHQHYFGSAILDSEISYRRGMPWFNAQDDWHGTDMPTTRYVIWSSNHNFIMPIHILNNYVFRYHTTLKTQYSKDRLFQTELFSIGNRYTVRGFDGEQTLAAEKGFFLQNNLEFPILKSLQTIYVGIDHGVIAGPSAQQLIGRQLTGAVTGISGVIKKIFNYDISIATSLRKPKGFQTKNTVIAFKASCHV